MVGGGGGRGDSPLLTNYSRKLESIEEEAETSRFEEVFPHPLNRTEGI
jgi:hypothetical protein